MNYGLYLSASGVLTNMYRQDVFANNLANVNTPGFKPDLPSIRHRDAEAIEGAAPSEFRNRLLDRIGGGSLAGRQSVSLQRGTIQPTGNPLDLALTAKDSFLAVRDTDAVTGQQSVRLTRDGRLAVDNQGRLVTQEGLPVLDAADEPIELDRGVPVQINSDGQVYQNGAAVAQIQVTGVRDTEALVKQGGNLLWFAGGRDLRGPAADASVQPRHTEASAVDPIRALMQLVSSTRAVTDNGNMIRYHDLVMDKAVNVLGRVG
ncbi:MAG: flagellar hook-basal body complex protein [Phycisphaeraceae bacterium]